jgi:uncharacterized protein DUF4214
MTPDYQPSLQPAEADEAFVQLCYRRLLSREPDEGGRITHLTALQHGLPRFDVIVSIVTRAEYYAVLTKSLFGDLKLPSLREMRPANFQTVFAVSGERVISFRPQNAAGQGQGPFHAGGTFML